MCVVLIVFVGVVFVGVGYFVGVCYVMNGVVMVVMFVVVLLGILLGVLVQQVVCKVLYWYDLMVLNQYFDKLGKLLFMDMQLQLVYVDESGVVVGIWIDLGLQQNFGICYVIVCWQQMVVGFDVVGIMQFDEVCVEVVQLCVMGYIDYLYVCVLMQCIVKGVLVVLLFVFDWFVLQEEYFVLKCGGMDGNLFDVVCV